MLAVIRAVISRRLDPASRLLLGQLVMFAGIAAVFPVAPLYVRSHGGGPTAVALFIAAPMVTNALVQVPAGHLVDRIGRKPVLIGSQLVFAALSIGLFVNLGPLWVLAMLRCGQGLTGGAYVPALRAALADMTPAGQRGERYAQLQAIEMVGLLIGPAIGGAIALWTYSAIFLCSGLGSLIGIMALIRLPETKGADADEPDQPVVPGWWRMRGVVIPSLGLLFAGMLFSMYDVVWPQYLSARHIGTFLIGISVSIFALPVLLFATSAGRLSDRVNRRILVGIAFVLLGTTAAIYPELQSFPLILVVGLFDSMGFMLVEPALFAVLSDSSAAEVRGRAMGLGGFFQFGGAAAGAGILGSLYGISVSLPFFGATCVGILAALLCSIWLPGQRLHQAPPERVSHLKAIDLETQL